MSLKLIAEIEGVSVAAISQCILLGINTFIEFMSVFLQIYERNNSFRFPWQLNVINLQSNYSLYVFLDNEYSSHT